MEGQWYQLDSGVQRKGSKARLCWLSRLLSLLPNILSQGIPFLTICPHGLHPLNYLFYQTVSPPVKFSRTKNLGETGQMLVQKHIPSAQVFQITTAQRRPHATFGTPWLQWSQQSKTQGRPLLWASQSWRFLAPSQADKCHAALIVWNCFLSALLYNLYSYFWNSQFKSVLHMGICTVNPKPVYATGLKRKGNIYSMKGGSSES